MENGVKLYTLENLLIKMVWKHGKWGMDNIVFFLMVMVVYGIILFPYYYYGDW